MKLLFLFVLLFVVGAFAQVAPAPSPAAPGFFAWLIGNQAVIGGFVVAVLDLLFALNKNLNAPDGLLHAVYLFFKNLGKPASPSQP